jgi:Leucine-rich repeat (LRR) protein
MQIARLDLSANNFLVLPPMSLFLATGTVCHLAFHSILTLPQQLPPQINRCRFLRVLSAHHNALRCMPDMTDCVYLQEVLLSHNKFKSVPLGAFYCGSLQLVDVRHNNILEPPT